MPVNFSVKPATVADIPLLQRLAHRIWRAHYPGIITTEQIDYMLADGYSDSRISHEMNSKEADWLLLLCDDEPVGFASFGPYSAETFKLHKLYIDVELHGKGLGSRALCEVEQLVKGKGGSAVVLNVNKYNSKAIASYRRNGYQVLESVTKDIGSGFVMDDFVMGKLLE